MRQFLKMYSVCRIIIYYCNYPLNKYRSLGPYVSCVIMEPLWKNISQVPRLWLHVWITSRGILDCATENWRFEVTWIFLEKEEIIKFFWIQPWGWVLCYFIHPKSLVPVVLWSSRTVCQMNNPLLLYHWENKLWEDELLYYSVFTV